MATINLQCNSTSQVFTSAENGMIGSTYMGEVLIQIWMKFMKK